MQPGAFPPWPQTSPSATPLRGADGLAANSSTRLIGCALLAVNAPLRGGPTLRSESGRLAARFFQRGSAPAPQPNLNCPASRTTAANQSTVVGLHDLPLVAVLAHRTI